MGVHLYASIHSSYSCRVPVTLMRYIILLSAAYSTLTRRGRGLNLQRGGEEEERTQLTRGGEGGNSCIAIVKGYYRRNQGSHQNVLTISTVDS